jgi:hypothetical protein
MSDTTSNLLRSRLQVSSKHKALATSGTVTTGENVELMDTRTSDDSTIRRKNSESDFWLRVHVKWHR